MFKSRIFLTSYRLEINGRRYHREQLTQSSLNRLMRTINNIPAAFKTVEIEDEGLGMALYVIMPRKAKKSVEATAAVMNCDATIAPVFEELGYLDTIECVSCHEIASIDDPLDGICSECRRKEEAIIEESSCGWCDGSDWTAKWKFGHSGGYEALKPCWKCNNG